MKAIKTYKKVVACVLAVTISAGATGFYAYNQKKNAAVINTSAVETETAVQDTEAVTRIAAEGTPFKDETVYVLCNNNSSVRDVIVSDWLKNPEALTDLADVSNLSDITNVKGDETFLEKGSDMTWEAGGNDIYYKGYSHSSLPVTVSMTYTLDGVSYDNPDDLKGKSGHLVIEWQYTNNQEVRTKINDRNVKLYVPFMATSTAILDNKVFQNVEVTNGKIISDGEKMIAVGMTFPGLSESLDLSNMKDIDIEIPETFTLEADVTDFSMEQFCYSCYK